jgi:hypothetical protein
MPAFTHATDDHSALDRREQFDGVRERFIYAMLELLNGA